MGVALMQLSTRVVTPGTYRGEMEVPKTGASLSPLDTVPLLGGPLLPSFGQVCFYSPL